jgi:hypothetical protein
MGGSPMSSIVLRSEEYTLGTSCQEISALKVLVAFDVRCSTWNMLLANAKRGNICPDACFTLTSEISIHERYSLTLRLAPYADFQKGEL